MKKVLYRDSSNRLTEVEVTDASDFISESDGVSDAGKPVKTDSLGKIDSSLVDIGPGGAATVGR